jgi:hypothetical protein
VRRKAKPEDKFPAPLRQFHEGDWPPVEGECLGVYTCRANGYGEPCAPRPGELCGQRCYGQLAADYPDRPEVLAANKTADAYQRFHQARLSWLGKDSDAYVDEFLEGFRAGDQIRYARFRNG